MTPLLLRQSIVSVSKIFIVSPLITRRIWWRLRKCQNGKRLWYKYGIVYSDNSISLLRALMKVVY